MNRASPRRAGGPGFRHPAALLLVCLAAWAAAAAPLEISGRYPHLATFNHQGECGTGAVVPWAGRLWVMTYGPHLPNGSDDKLYEIDDALNRVTRPESVGGTPAGRMIHRESAQLVMGPYFIDTNRNVRVISPKTMPGRLSAVARHLTDPANKVYVYDMEGMLYEVDVHSLAVKKIFDKAVPGWHGKGAYSGQGRLVVGNNGESAAAGHSYATLLAGGPAKNDEEAGVLAEWDGTTWSIVARRQFTEVTGPGGIKGAPAPDAALWSVGWDRRSLLLYVRNDGAWHAFRLPKADYSYDGKHGWHTEWPRIREVEPGHWLMNMHGGWFDFPGTFAAGRAGGLRPIGAYLKVTADFCYWNGRLVFACDDLALSDFGAGNSVRAGLQSQSDLWFTHMESLKECGAPSGFGGPWVRDPVKAGVPSDPYLLNGYDRRLVHLAHDNVGPVTFTLETDVRGDGAWKEYKKIVVPPRTDGWHEFPGAVDAAWIRVKTDQDCARAMAYFHYGSGGGAKTDRAMFAALADVEANGPWISGEVMAQGNDTGVLRFDARPVDAEGRPGAAQAYEIGPDLKFKAVLAAKSDPTVTGNAKSAVRISGDAASVIVEQGKVRVRVPKTDTSYDAPGAAAPRIREVVTERSLLNAHGTFYVVPRENSGGLLRMKPVCTHSKQIADFCSWRGLLVLVGVAVGAKADGHCFPANAAGGPALWFGDIDDLWKMGKPRGQGGPWLDTAVGAGRPSDPFLMTGYDRKALELSHDATRPVKFTVEVDVTADGTWLKYDEFTVEPGSTITHLFPKDYAAHWVRVTSDTACHARAIFIYE